MLAVPAPIVGITPRGHESGERLLEVAHIDRVVHVTVAVAVTGTDVERDG
jgi:hypothetical protein